MRMVSRYLLVLLCLCSFFLGAETRIHHVRSSASSAYNRNLFRVTKSPTFLPDLYSSKCMVGENLYTPYKGYTVPWITVDLDLPPRQRFQAAFRPHAEQMREVIGIVKGVVGSFGQLPVDLLEMLMRQAHKKLFPSPYREEIEGIALATGIPVAELAMLNVFYELSRFCTSIIAENEVGKLFHARNLDFGQLFGWNSSTHTWTLTEALKKVTLNIDYMRNGKLLFKGTTFAGHVGIITGMKPNAFTISMNSQIKPDLKNLVRWLAGMMSKRRAASPHFVMWVEREAMTSCGTYDEAKTYLSNVKLLTGCYYILGGKNSGEGVVIVRDAEGTKQLVELQPDNGKWFLLQTNYDPNEKPFFLDNRRDPGMQCMRELGQSDVTLAGLYEVLSSKTTLNKTTVHTVIMSLEDDLYEVSPYFRK